MTHEESLVETRVRFFSTQAAMAVSRDIFPWSVIISHLEQQTRLAHEAEKAEHAASLIQLWEEMTCGVYCLTNPTKITYFTQNVANMLLKLVGGTTAREMVLRRLYEEKPSSNSGLPGGRVWRLYMLLAGCCVTSSKNRLTVFGSEPSTALWGRRLTDEFGLLGHNWIWECLIFSGVVGKISIPDDNSPTWVDGVTSHEWFSSA